MGLGCLYLPMYYLGGQYYPAGKPVYLNKDSSIIYLDSNSNEREITKIFRKTRLNYWEHVFVEAMVGDVFEGSNSLDFTDAHNLYTIDSWGDHFEIKPSNTEKKFRYVRYRILPSTGQWTPGVDKSLRLAEIAFLGKDDKPLKGNPIASKKELLNTAHLAFDNDIRTNFASDTLVWIGLDLGKPRAIKNVKYLFQNSFNTIEPGDTYELLYWDNVWKSLGSQVAKYDYVEFKVPKNTVLWLRNLTKGKEELPFFIKNGKQVWSE